MHALPTAGGGLNRAAPLFSHDNAHLIVAQGSGLIILDAQDLRVVRRLGETSKRRAADRTAGSFHASEGDALITAMALNPLCKEEVFAGCRTGLIFRWNFVRGELMGVLSTKIRIQRMFGAAEGNLHDRVFVGGKALGGAGDGAARRQKLYCIRAGNFKTAAVQRVAELGPSEDVVAALSKDGRHLVWAVANVLHVWDVVNDAGQEHLQEIRVQGGKIARLAMHPSEPIVYWSNEAGEMFVKHLEHAEKGTARDAQVHWHSQAPTDMVVTGDGLRLLTGGAEGVLVSWSFDPLRKAFLPHLGSPIVGIASSSTGSHYAVLLACNSVLMILPGTMKPTARFDCLKSSPNGLKLANGPIRDPRNSSAILLNSVPGELQSFDPVRNCSSGRDIDVCGQNIVTRGGDGQVLVQSDVHCVAFSADGLWMATYERRNTSERHLQHDSLRFWRLRSDDSDDYELFDTIEGPHQDIIHQMAFVSVPFGGVYRCLTVGADGAAKLWANNNVRIDRTDPLTGRARPKTAWTHVTSLSFRALPCRAVAGSADGSIMAISFGLVVALFDPLSGKLLGTLSAVQGTGAIKEMAFLGDHLMGLDDNSLYSWEVPSLRLLWALQFPAVHGLKAHPAGKVCSLLVTTENGEAPRRVSSALVFRPETGIPADCFAHDCELLGCEFVSTATRGEYVLACLDIHNHIIMRAFTAKVRLPRAAETNKYVDQRKKALAPESIDALAKTKKTQEKPTTQPPPRKLILPQVSEEKLFLSHIPSHQLPNTLEAFERFIRFKLPARSQ